MSKAFTREGEGEGEAWIGRVRAPLPAGVPNYVTPRGLRLLEEEAAVLEKERGAAEGAAERARATALAAQQAELLGRIHGATVVEGPGGPPDQVRFGATVTVRDADGGQRRYQIVGVDEANGREGRVAFTSPVARALLGRRPGDLTSVRSPRGDEELEVIDITYEDTEL